MTPVVVLSDSLEPNNLRLVFDGFNAGRDVVDDLRQDLSFARTLVRTLTPLARGGPVPMPPDLFPPPRALRVPALAGKRVGLLASGGSGATAALCGVRRAFEEAGVEVAQISACSGAVLFATLWGAGLSAEEMARFWLSLRTRDYVDPSWLALARAPLRGFRAFGGLLRGQAIERTYRRRFDGLTLGDMKVRLSAVVWNIDLNRVEHFENATMPDLPIARLVRVATAIPIFVEPVRIGDHHYGDGGIVDIFPATPIVEAKPPLDIVFGINSYLPERFAGVDLSGWYDQRWAILQAAGQLRYATYLELAREHVRALGSRLVLLQPVPHDEVRGAHFYETFLDRSRWPRYMRAGYDATRHALEQLAAGAPVEKAPAAP